MIGSFLTRGLVMAFGYAYPAYECFKTVEMNKPDIEQLRFWCQYWILVAVLTVCERIGDTFVSWVPMYSEAKLAFFIYLWYPRTKGTTYVYDSFFRPYIAKHEPEIDRNLLELRTRAGDIAVVYWQKAASYGQTRVFEILQYVAAQSTPRPRPAQPQQQGTRARKPAAVPNRRQTSKVPSPSDEQPSPASSSSASSSQDEQEDAQESGASQSLTAAPPVTTVLNAPKPPAVQPPAVQPPAEKSNHANANETDEMQTEPVPSSANENVDPPAQETVMEEAIRATRTRLRKARSAPANRK
ncbi:putative HVA22-like protein g [Rhododendron vialii]|uniref:putative HVA22-like protein g n=1 Tax=Rhododendron vialii TaxID=182163 RepID=UPI00265DD56D|nr:putative HVA22-like protein g [Rhododendron vialii]